MKHQEPGVKADALTISLAGVVDSGEVLVAAALVGTLGVVADVRTHPELPALVLVCQRPGHEQSFRLTETGRALRVIVKAEKIAPSHRLRPVDWKPGLHEQKEFVPFTTQWASSPSPQTVLLLRQSFSIVSVSKETGISDPENRRSLRGRHTGTHPSYRS